MQHHHTHPLHVRIGHWINAVTLFALLWTGFAMLASNRHFAMIVHALPAWLWSGLQLRGHALSGRAWHLGFALVMIANALWYAVATVRTASWRRLLPNARTWLQDAVRATIAASGGSQNRTPMGSSKPHSGRWAVQNRTLGLAAGERHRLI